MFSESLREKSFKPRLKSRQRVAENRKARLEKSVLVNGWTSSEMEVEQSLDAQTFGDSVVQVNQSGLDWTCSKLFISELPTCMHSPAMSSAGYCITGPVKDLSAESMTFTQHLCITSYLFTLPRVLSVICKI